MNIFYSYAALTHKILFLPLEDKMQIIVPTCGTSHINMTKIKLTWITHVFFVQGVR